MLTGSRPSTISTTTEFCTIWTDVPKVCRIIGADDPLEDEKIDCLIVWEAECAGR